LLKKTINTKPKDATHWSCRDFAGETGASKSTVQRVWSSFGIKPHRSRSFKLSTDPFFVEKVRDILGLLPWSPGQRARSVCGRKEPMPGLGAQSAQPFPWALDIWKVTPTTISGVEQRPCLPLSMLPRVSEYLSGASSDICSGSWSAIRIKSCPAFMCLQYSIFILPPGCEKRSGDRS
jgi:hypothetical protein